MDVGCGMPWFHSIIWFNNLTTPYFQKIPKKGTSHHHTVLQYGWTPQHMKVINTSYTSKMDVGHSQRVQKYFIYICYGCGMKSVGFPSINHDTTMSLELHLTPIFQKFTTIKLAWSGLMYEFLRGGLRVRLWTRVGW